MNKRADSGSLVPSLLRFRSGGSIPHKKGSTHAVQVGLREEQQGPHATSHQYDVL